MSQLSAAPSGTIQLLGERAVRRLGFGAMRITGPGIWGPPKDPAGARATLRRVRELGIDFIDTADAYGPFISEDLIAEVLHPYENILIATKGGLTRQGANSWQPLGRPEYLKQCVHMSLRRLKVERIDLWQLHRIDPAVPAGEQFDCIAEMQKEGLIHYAGLSEVSVDEIKAAQKNFPVASVQNHLQSWSTARAKIVLDYCEQHAIGFIPWFPLAAGALAKPDSALGKIAHRLNAPLPRRSRWPGVLRRRRSKAMLPIPGTSSAHHLAENVAAASIKLTDGDFARVSDKASRAAQGHSKDVTNAIRPGRSGSACRAARCW